MRVRQLGIILVLIFFYLRYLAIKKFVDLIIKQVMFNSKIMALSLKNFHAGGKKYLKK